MRSLVTGGAGFLGAWLCGELRGMGHEVTALDDLSGGFEDNVPSGVPLVVCDVVDADAVDALFAARQFDYVYHLAAYAAEGLSHFIRRFNYRNNLIGSATIINACIAHKVKRLVFTSSMAVYGSHQVPFREDMAPEPEDPYGIAKAAVECDLKVAHDLFGLEYTIFRPHNIYGSKQNLWDPYRNVVGIFMRQVLRGEPMTIFGDGEQTRAFSHISDVVWPLAQCVDMPETAQQTVNIGGDMPVTVNTLATAVAEALDVESSVLHLPERHEVKDAWCDHEKAKALFHWRPCTALTAGLSEMASWARDAIKRQRHPRRFWGIEVTEGLPEKWQREVV